MNGISLLCGPASPFHFNLESVKCYSLCNTSIHTPFTHQTLTQLISSILLPTFPLSHEDTYFIGSSYSQPPSYLHTQSLHLIESRKTFTNSLQAYQINMLFCYALLRVLTAISAVWMAHEAVKTTGVDLFGYVLQTLDIAPTSSHFFRDLVHRVPLEVRISTLRRRLSC